MFFLAVNGDDTDEFARLVETISKLMNPPGRLSPAREGL